MPHNDITYTSNWQYIENCVSIKNSSDDKHGWAALKNKLNHMHVSTLMYMRFEDEVWMNDATLGKFQGIK